MRGRRKNSKKDIFHVAKVCLLPSPVMMVCLNLDLVLLIIGWTWTKTRGVCRAPGRRAGWVMFPVLWAPPPSGLWGENIVDVIVGGSAWVGDVLETASGRLQGIRREDVDNRNGKSSGFVEETSGSIVVSDILFDPSVVPLPNHCQNENINKKGGKETHKGSAL